jgi:hypothetical protein
MSYVKFCDLNIGFSMAGSPLTLSEFICGQVIAPIIFLREFEGIFHENHMPATPLSLVHCAEPSLDPFNRTLEGKME